MNPFLVPAIYLMAPAIIPWMVWFAMVESAGL
jgi:hypothetical protein